MVIYLLFAILVILVVISYQLQVLAVPYEVRVKRAVEAPKIRARERERRRALGRLGQEEASAKLVFAFQVCQVFCVSLLHWRWEDFYMLLECRREQLKAFEHLRREIVHGPSPRPTLYNGKTADEVWAEWVGRGTKTE